MTRELAYHVRNEKNLDAFELYVCVASFFDGSYGKLVDNFSHESDVTSLQDPFTSRPYKAPSRHVPTRPLSIFTIVFPVKSQEAFFFESCRIFAIF